MELPLFGGEQVHSDLPLEAKGQLVPEAEDSRHPTISRDTKLLVHDDRPGGGRHGPKHPSRRSDQVHCLAAGGEGRQQAGELPGRVVQALQQGGAQGSEEGYESHRLHCNAPLLEQAT